MNGSQAILITDGGAHPPEKWALATADHLVHLSPTASPEKRMAAMKLELAIAQALIPHHSIAQADERAALASLGDDHLESPIEVAQHVDDALAAVVACAKDTPWEAHFARPDVQAVIRQTLGTHFATSKHIERSWHCDRRPDTAKVMAWRAKYRPNRPVAVSAPPAPPASIAPIKPE